MFKNFSNEPTARAFDLLVEHPDLYERAVKASKSKPVTAPIEIRTWVTALAKSAVKDVGLQDFVDAALRSVRWAEIRAELQRQPNH